MFYLKHAIACSFRLLVLCLRYLESDLDQSTSASDSDDVVIVSVEPGSRYVQRW